MLVRNKFATYHNRFVVGEYADDERVSGSEPILDTDVCKNALVTSEIKLVFVFENQMGRSLSKSIFEFSSTASSSPEVIEKAGVSHALEKVVVMSRAYVECFCF